jgi:hypothetical protein
VLILCIGLDKSTTGTPVIIPPIQKKLVKQTGSTAKDVAYSACSDTSGNVVVVGMTEGDIAAPNQGGSDAFVAKYDADGQLLNLFQFGTLGNDEAVQVLFDQQNNFFVIGYTEGSLMGEDNIGERDIFVAKVS